jgi:hypothetical protein
LFETPGAERVFSDGEDSLDWWKRGRGANDRGGETALGSGFLPDEIVQRRDFDGASGGGLVFEVREVHQSQGRLSWTVTPKIPTALKRSVF